MPVPAGCCRPEHQKDRPGTHQSTKTRPRLRSNPSADQNRRNIPTKHISPKQNPAKMTGFVSGLTPPFRWGFSFSRRIAEGRGLSITAKPQRSFADDVPAKSVRDVFWRLKLRATLEKKRRPAGRLN